LNISDITVIFIVMHALEWTFLADNIWGYCSYYGVLCAWLMLFFLWVPQWLFCVCLQACYERSRSSFVRSAAADVPAWHEAWQHQNSSWDQVSDQWCYC